MGTENGYIKSYRSTIEKPWYSKSAYFHLWHHLLYSATYKEMEVFFNNTTLKLKPGQLITGRKALSKDTGINESKIERILTYFEKTEQQIEQQKTNKNRLITVLNWEKYQSTEQQAEQQINNSRTTNEQQMNTNKNIKKDNNEKNEKNIIPAPLNLVIQYCKERNNSIDPQYFHDYNEARGWKINGKLMKDWQACIRTWERNSFNVKKSNPNDPDEFLKQLKAIEARNGN